MPSSKLEVWPTLLHLVWQVQPKSILDVGAGRGKGGLLVAEYVGRTTGAPPNGPIETIDAVEVERAYVTPTLKAIYDEVFVQDVRDRPRAGFEEYDLVVLVDVIEHLEKQEGLALLRRIPGWVVVSTPCDFFDTDDGLAPSETHRSLWSTDDFVEVRTIEEDASTAGGILLRLAPLS